MVNYDFQRQASGSGAASSSNGVPKFTVCDVNEDAANNIVGERFPEVNIAIRKTPARYVRFAS